MNKYFLSYMYETQRGTCFGNCEMKMTDIESFDVIKIISKELTEELKNSGIDVLGNSVVILNWKKF